MSITCHSKGNQTTTPSHQNVWVSTLTEISELHELLLQKKTISFFISLWIDTFSVFFIFFFLCVPYLSLDISSTHLPYNCTNLSTLIVKCLIDRNAWCEKPKK